MSGKTDARKGRIAGADTAASGWQDSDWLWGALLFAAVVLAYARVWHAGFIWDDDDHLTRNPCIIGPLGFPSIWTTSRAVYYPLVLTSFWIQHAIWGLNPLPYHVVDVALHAAGALLLWRVLRRLDVAGAWLGAAIWALHPVQVESAAWITEQKNTQSGCFYLLAILLFLGWRRADQAPDPSRATGFPRSRYYGGALVCATLAILSKSSTVMLPVVLGLCWWWMDGRWRWRNVFWLAPFLMVSGAASAWTVWEQRHVDHALGAEWSQSWPERAVVAGKDIWFYLWKLAWPQPLTFIYPVWNTDASDLWAYLPLAAAVCALGLLWVGRKGPLRPVLFAYAYFLVSLFPVLSFFNVYFFRYSFVGDHFQYLASMGPLVLAGAAIASAAKASRPEKRLVYPVASGTLLIVLAGLTWRQSESYRDLETLWRTTITRNPGSWLAHLDLGTLLLKQGRLDESIAESREALRLNQELPEAHINIGAGFLRMGRINEAITELGEALRMNPSSGGAHDLLGNAYYQTGRPDAAIAEFSNAVRLDPSIAEAYYNLGVIQFERGNCGESAANVEKALELDPTNVAFVGKLAWILAAAPEVGVRDGPRAIQLATQANEATGGNDPLILRTLAAAYAQDGQYYVAVQNARRAMDLAAERNLVSVVNALRQEIGLYASGRPFTNAH